MAKGSKIAKDVGKTLPVNDLICKFVIDRDLKLSINGVSP